MASASWDDLCSFRSQLPQTPSVLNTAPHPDAAVTGYVFFLENYRDFCCLNSWRVLSLLYVPSGTAYGTDLVEKDIGIDK